MKAKTLTLRNVYVCFSTLRNVYVCFSTLRNVYVCCLQNKPTNFLNINIINISWRVVGITLLIYFFPDILHVNACYEYIKISNNKVMFNYHNHEIFNKVLSFN